HRVEGDLRHLLRRDRLRQQRRAREREHGEPRTKHHVLPCTFVFAAPAPVAPGIAVNYHGGMVASQEVIVSNDAKVEPTDLIRRLIDLPGLTRALALFPDPIPAAFVRGRRPIGAFPEKYSATTEPAARFSAVPEADE